MMRIHHPSAPLTGGAASGRTPYFRRHRRGAMLAICLGLLAGLLAAVQLATAHPAVRARSADVTVSGVDAARTALKADARGNGPTPLFFTDQALARIPLHVQSVELQTGDAYSATVFYDPIDNDVLTGQLIIGRGHTFDPSVNPGGSCTGDPIIGPMTLGPFHGVYLAKCDITFSYRFSYKSRGYTVASKYHGGLTATTLGQLVGGLTPVIYSAPKDPCAARWPNDRAQRRSHGRLIYDRHTPLRMVCQGFGTDTGGLSINWLNWGMKCAIVAKAIGAHYHLDPMFTDGACSAGDVALHPGPVSAIGAVCSTASTLLGFAMPVLGAISGVACTEAPSVGTGFGTKLEAHHEFAVAKDVMRRGRCIEYRKFLGVSSWHAVRCLRWTARRRKVALSASMWSVSPDREGV